MLKLSDKDGFVLFRQPESEEIFFIQGNWQTSESLPSSSNGFIVSNLDQSKFHILQEQPQLLETSPHIEIDQVLEHPNSISKNEYLAKANTFINACSNDIRKVILSRVKIVTNTQKNIFSLFRSLCNTYNHSFNYLLNIPNVGMWMGATPERLILGNRGAYSTVSLAGSKKASDNSPWTVKEFQEQQFVTDYISEQLRNNQIAYSSPQQATTVHAGNVSHLQTIFTIKSTLSSLTIANLLHPTPAIGGIPKDSALSFIKKNEGYERELYTGYLGYFSDSKTDLFINLRCMRLFSNYIKLFVGGGITKDSIPENEWNETELKAQTLLAVIEKM